MNAIGLIGLSVDIDFSLARAAIIYIERHIGRKIADRKRIERIFTFVIVSQSDPTRFLARCSSGSTIMYQFPGSARS